MLAHHNWEMTYNAHLEEEVARPVCIGLAHKCIQECLEDGHENEEFPRVISRLPEDQHQKPSQAHCSHSPHQQIALQIPPNKSQ